MLLAFAAWSDRSPRPSRALSSLPSLLLNPSVCFLWLQEAGSSSLPLLTAPHDALRQGLVTLKDGAAASHPVEQIQKLSGPAGEKARLEMLSNVYGTALPARMQIERQILDRQGGGSWGL